MNSETPAVSELLKKIRKQQGLTVKAVAEEICVQSTYLRAIEAGEYDKLPAQTFAVGFVRSYASALGQDADQIVTSFKKECGLSEPAAPQVAVNHHQQKARKVPAWLSPLAGLVGASLCWMVLGGSFTGSVMVAEAEGEIALERERLAAIQQDLNAVTPMETEVAAAPSADFSVTETPSKSLFAPAAYADEPEKQIAVAADVLLRAIEDSWVRIAREDGSEIWSGILRTGQSYQSNEEGPLLLTTSNAGGLLISQEDGQELELGARGAIVSDYALPPSSQFSDSSAAVSYDSGTR